MVTTYRSTSPPALEPPRHHRNAFADLWDTHAAAAYRLARAVCADDEQTERVLTRAFIAARSTGHARPLAVGWFLSLVHRLAVAEAHRGPAPSAPLAALPEAQGEILALAWFGPLSCEQIAAHLDISPGTVKHLMRAALHALAAEPLAPAQSRVNARLAS